MTEHANRTELESTNNPHGIIHAPGGQWPEARTFPRVYAFNPFAQSRLLETLASLYAVADEGWGVAGNPRQPEDTEVARDAIATVIEYIANDFPDWRNPVDSGNERVRMEGMPYVPDERIVRIIDGILERHDLPNGGPDA